MSVSIYVNNELKPIAGVPGILLNSVSNKLENVESSLTDAMADVTDFNLRVADLEESGGGGGGSAIVITAPDFAGKNVSVTGKVDTYTVPLSEEGEAIVNVKYLDTYTVTCEGETKAVEVTTIGAIYRITLSSVHIYGVKWDGGSQTTWIRTDDASGFSDPVPYVAGATSYGSPFDSLYPWSYMVKGDRTGGGTVVRIPKFWYKITQNGNGMKIQIADKPLDGFFTSPAHMDRNDGKGERDVVYVGRYHCASDYKSKTGNKPVAKITRSTARSGIHSLGSNIWQIDFATRFTIWLLYLVEFADWNSQEKIGYGCGDGSAVENMGYTDSMPYHTGTMLSSRTSYGVGTQYRYIEGLWDNVNDWLDGCYYDRNGLNIVLNPASFSDSSGGVAVGVPSVTGFPGKFAVKDVSGTFPMFIPTEEGGSSSTYSCDHWIFQSSMSGLAAGGSYERGLGCGLFDVGCNPNSYSGIGCRLMELP